MARSSDEKINTVIARNTFWLNNKAFEEGYEASINALKETLLVLRNQVQNQGLTKKLLDNLISEKEYGLKALLALTGFSNESFKRLITFIRVTDDKELSRISYRDLWINEAELNSANITEWSDSKIGTKIQNCANFRKGIVNLFYQGSSVPVLSKTLPLFELKKLSICKLSFDPDAMIDTLIRYKKKGLTPDRQRITPKLLSKTS